jgi:hypothetical protein
MKKFYHYTSRASLRDILTSRKLYPSSYVRSDDSTYGTGFYLTDLPPETYDEDLFYYLWGTRNPDDEIKDRVRGYLIIEIHESLEADRTIQEYRKHVFKINDSLIPNSIINIDTNYTRNNIVVLKVVGGYERNNKSKTNWGKVFGSILLVGLSVLALGAIFGKGK